MYQILNEQNKVIDTKRSLKDAMNIIDLYPKTYSVINQGTGTKVYPEFSYENEKKTNTQRTNSV